MIATVYFRVNDHDFFEKNQKRRIFACSTKAQKIHSDPSYQPEDMLLFGPETRGLNFDIRERYQTIRIPMCASSRSLNLSNAVAIILFEAWRQLGFVT